MDEKNSIIYFVTSNKNKYIEVSDLFRKSNLKYKLKQSHIKPIEIQAKTIKEVAEYKLNSVKDLIQGSYFIEDAGFFVDNPLNNFPGVYSSYVFETIGNEGIMKLIEDFSLSEAHFAAVIALYFQPLDKTYIFQGEIKGKISDKIKGTGGFGYDPIFIPYSLKNKTFAEISTEEKNKISHRGQALQKLIEFLKIS